MDELDLPGKRIRRLRLAKGLSQAELASRAGISRQSLNGIENSRDRMPYSDTLDRLAAALDTTPLYLANGRQAPPIGDEWPPLEVCLRHTSTLDEDDIAAIVRIVRSLEMEQAAARAEAAGADPGGD